MQPISLAASATLNRDTHANGPLIKLNAAAGLTVTLPASTGKGDIYRLFVETTVTSNNDVIQVANSTDVMAGMIITAQDGGDTTTGWETAAASDTITMNGTTKGGVQGDYIELEDASAGRWRVLGHTSATGTEVTPFSAAV
jgi:hypothetical protein